MTTRIPRKAAKQAKVGNLFDMKNRDWAVLAEFFGFRNGDEMKSFAYQQAIVALPARSVSDK